MKRLIKSIAGVTLLEIMLVLAIASMVIVMSIRYYQNASTNAKINVVVDHVTGVVAAAESYLASSGTFSGSTATNLLPYLPGGSMPNSPWGGAMTYAAGGANMYTLVVPSISSSACTTLTGLLGSNTKFAVTCANGITIVVTE
jgi:Tfp pilus assembly protein PilE